MIEPSKWPKIAKPVVIIIIIIVAIIAATSIVLGQLSPGPVQPVWFSHRIHAGTKKIDCFFCHQYAANSRNAGIPSVEKCMLCHKVIASNWQPIKTLRGYYDRQDPIPWVRVYRLPDHAQFSHQPHIARGFDCGVCHGNVKAMDRIKQVNKINMRFCVDCHWKNNFSVSCQICHY